MRREPNILRLPTAAKAVRTNTRFSGSALTSSSPMRVSMSQSRSLFSSPPLLSTTSRDLVVLGSIRLTAADRRRRKNRTAGELAMYTRDTTKTHPTKNEDTVRLRSYGLVGVAELHGHWGLTAKDLHETRPQRGLPNQKAVLTSIWVQLVVGGCTNGDLPCRRSKRWQSYGG